MASINVCAACRQVLRLQLRHFRQLQTQVWTPTYSHSHSPSHTNSRLFSAACAFSAAQSEPKVTQPTEPTPSSPVKQAHSDPPPTLETPTRSFAKELRERAKSTTETYVAYGVCEKLIQECARQANYTIPQAHEKDVPVPKTKDGEDLGVGTGWWFESKDPSTECRRYSQALWLFATNCPLQPSV